MLKAKAIIKSALICIVVYIIIKLSIKYVSPFLLSLAISFIIEPLIKIMMDKMHMSRKLSIIISLLFFCLFLIFIVLFSISNIYRETISVLKDFPGFYDKLQNISEKIIVYIRKNYNINIDEQKINILNSEKILYSILNIFSNIKDKIMQFLYSLPDIIMYISFSVFAAFFILRDREKIIAILKKNLPSNFLNVCSKLNESLLSVIKTELILIFISTIETILGLMRLKVNLALLIGILSGIMDILPIVGPGIIFIPWSLYNFVIGNYFFAVALVCLYIIIIVTRQVLETRLISFHLDLHPLVILLSVYIGVRLFGIIGAVTGPLMIVIFKLIYAEIKIK